VNLQTYFMCGIIGVTGSQSSVDLIVSGLKRLEYRGYDSAGVATNHGGVINRVRAEGKIKNLEDAVAANPIKGNHRNRSYTLGNARQAF
jgi:glucosamine--fructose-6-phosphate aminotransferase (isomerizing)